MKQKNRIKRERKQFKFILLINLFLIVLIFLLNANLISSQQASYCCERILAGSWCQQAPQEICDPSFRMVPTSCEATSYCRLGTCYDSQEGTCMENTPQKVCDDEGGVWDIAFPEELPQCQLGCCLIGDQASFVTQTRCKRLSSIYGLEINFRTDIGNEFECIASAASDVKGACVFEKEFEKTCLFTTKRECQNMQATDPDISFYQDILCSAEDLGANCGPTEQTTCVDGKDQIYLVDSCGNLANVYDASRIDDKIYWKEVFDESESCGFGSSNVNSPSCGNCDYFLGSTCKEYKGVTGRPAYGDNICKDLSCEYLGEKFEHGETWCAYNQGNLNNLPGSRHFRLVCYNGEVTVEPCADFRQETCIESEVNGFLAAACRVNRWQDCIAQDNPQDCENTDRRDCAWMGGYKEGFQCVPLYTPGLDFWQAEGDAQALCSQASTQCIVTYEKKLTGGKKCVDNCECLTPSWEIEMNNMCIALGDCGVNVNYIGTQGYNQFGDAVFKQDYEEENAE